MFGPMRMKSQRRVFMPASTIGSRRASVRTWAARSDSSSSKANCTRPAWPSAADAHKARRQPDGLLALANLRVEDSPENDKGPNHIGEREDETRNHKLRSSVRTV